MDPEPNSRSWIRMIWEAFYKISVTTLFFGSSLLLLFGLVFFPFRHQGIKPQNTEDVLVLADIVIFFSSSCVLALGKLISRDYRVPNLLGFLKDQVTLKIDFSSRRTGGPEAKVYMEKVRSINLVVSILVLIVTVLMILNHELEPGTKKEASSSEQRSSPLATDAPVNSARPPSNEPVSKVGNGRQSKGIHRDLSPGFRKLILNLNYTWGLLCFLFGLWTAEMLDTAANPFVDRRRIGQSRQQRFFYHEALTFGGSGYYYVTVGLFSLLVLSIFSLLLHPWIITALSVFVIGFASTYFYGYYEKLSIESDTELIFRCCRPIWWGVFLGTLSVGIILGVVMYAWFVSCVSCENLFWLAWIADIDFLLFAWIIRIEKTRRPGESPFD